MRRFHAHTRDVFPTFMKFGGPPKEGGGGVLTPRTPPPLGSAPESPIELAISTAICAPIQIKHVHFRLSYQQVTYTNSDWCGHESRGGYGPLTLSWPQGGKFQPISMGNSGKRSSPVGCVVFFLLYVTTTRRHV